MGKCMYCEKYCWSGDGVYCSDVEELEKYAPDYDNPVDVEHDCPKFIKK